MRVGVGVGVREWVWGRVGAVLGKGGRSRTGALERAPDLGRPVVMGAGRDLGRSSRERRSSRETSGLRPPSASHRHARLRLAAGDAGD